ncbi:hypothetical protein [Kytococcus sp. Marseille-QA3725]
MKATPTQASPQDAKAALIGLLADGVWVQGMRTHDQRKARVLARELVSLVKGEPGRTSSQRQAVEAAIDNGCFTNAAIREHVNKEYGRRLTPRQIAQALEGLKRRGTVVHVDRGVWRKATVRDRGEEE